jgi:hypothetical protein
MKREQERQIRCAKLTVQFAVSMETALHRKLPDRSPPKPDLYKSTFPVNGSPASGILQLILNDGIGSENLLIFAQS